MMNCNYSYARDCCECCLPLCQFEIEKLRAERRRDDSEEPEEYDYE